jgi:hypothetical protein
MRKIAEAIGQEAQWAQPSTWQQEYELRVGDDVAATLRFRSGFGSMAAGESADGRWTFKRVGFWHPQVTVRAHGAETDNACAHQRADDHRIEARILDEPPGS